MPSSREPGAPEPLGGFIEVETMSLSYFISDMEMGPLGQYLYVVGRDRTTSDPVIFAYAIDEMMGTLTTVPGTFETVPNAKRIEVDPDRRFLWVLTITEVFTYAITPNTGTLGLIDADGDPINGATGFAFTRPNDIAVTPDGQTLFAVGAGSTHTLTIGADGLLSEDVPSLATGGLNLKVFSRLP